MIEDQVKISTINDSGERKVTLEICNKKYCDREERRSL